MVGILNFLDILCSTSTILSYSISILPEIFLKGGKFNTNDTFYKSKNIIFLQDKGGKINAITNFKKIKGGQTQLIYMHV